MMIPARVSYLADAAQHREAEAQLGRREMSSSDLVVKTIKDNLRSGRYVPGQRLVETDLTAELGVSRGPVREALKRLAAEGMVKHTPNRGAQIRRLTLREVNDLLAVLEPLTGLQARFAAQRIEEGKNRDMVRAALDRLLSFRKRGDTIPFLEARRNFYDTLLAAGGNEELKRIIPLMQIHIIRLQFSDYLVGRDRERRFDEYEGFGAAVIAGEAKRAERLARIHIRRTRLALNRLSPDAYARE
ncbi:MAG: GntR family transcriptional regulator [Rhodothalassiaceae bacterium]